MPLAIVCGLPCAGKTAVSLRLKGLIEERYPEYSVSLINDESLSLCKASGYENASEEKRSRAAFISAVERSIGRNTVVIADGLNYIKGYRYQLYCIARAASTPHCAVNVFCSLEAAKARNAGRPDRYPEGTLEELASRFEEPNHSTKWDSPLFFVDSGSVTEGSLDEIAAALCREKPKKQPSFATALKGRSAPDFVRDLDQQTQDVLDRIIAQMKPFGPSVIHIEGADPIRLASPIPLGDLANLRRQFMHMNRSHPMDSSQIQGLFVKYICDTIHAGRIKI